MVTAHGILYNYSDLLLGIAPIQLFQSPTLLIWIMATHRD